jgi:hypothetical protein
MKENVAEIVLSRRAAETRRWKARQEANASRESSRAGSRAPSRAPSAAPSRAGSRAPSLAPDHNRRGSVNFVRRDSDSAARW